MTLSFISQSAIHSRNQQQMAVQRTAQQAPGQSTNQNLSPNPNQPQMPVQQSQPFSNPGGNPPVDQRMLQPHQQSGLPNINNLTANQRTLLMMQQQMRSNGTNAGMNAVNPAMLNSQIAAAQERMRQEQRMSASAGSPPHGHPPMGNGMGGGDQFAMMRSNSNSALPGIARSGRSPTDGSSMQGRIVSGSQPSAEDMQRALFMQQQRNMMGAQNNNQGYVNPQQIFNGGGGNNWGQQQQQQQGGMGGQQQQGYGMSPPPSAGGQGNSGYMSSPDPQQQWGQGGGGLNTQYSYNAAPSPAGDRTSATPTPSQQMSHSPPGSMDPSQSLSDFDLFNWAQ
jgi:hypothetical protein